MKIAAAEAQWETCQPCSFSVFQIGGDNEGRDPDQDHRDPAPAVGPGDRDLGRRGAGAERAEAQYNQQYGPGYYVPNVFIQYWSMRVMAYLGPWSPLFGAVGRLAGRTDELDDVARVPVRGDLGRRAPFLMNTAGWMLTENGRQPWIVQGLMLTTDGVSHVGQRDPARRSASASSCSLYAALGVVAVVLMLRHARRGLELEHDEAERDRTAAALHPRPRPDRTEERPVNLADLWFVIVAFFWTGFFVLEGFDFGVGVLHTVVGRTDLERRVAINTIGPFWDGNEVWLVVGGAAMFAAFPAWYATWFSGGYLAVAAARGADRPRGLVRVPRQGRHRPVARAWSLDLMAGSLARPAAARRRAGRPARGPADRRRTASSPARSGTCSPRTGSRRPDACWCCACCTVRRSWPCAPPATLRRRAQRLGVRSCAGGPGGRGRLRVWLWPSPTPGSALRAARARSRRRRGRRHRSAPGTGTDGRSPRPRSPSAATVGALFASLYPDVLVSSTERRVQPDGENARRATTRSGDDDRRGGLLPAGAALPGLDVLRLPAPHRWPASTVGAAAEPRTGLPGR